MQQEPPSQQQGARSRSRPLDMPSPVADGDATAEAVDGEEKAKEAEAAPRPGLRWAWLAANAAVSVALVLTNKRALGAAPQRSFIICLTLVHQLCNLAYVTGATRLGFRDAGSGLQPSRIDAIGCAVGFASYITLSNSSLSSNSVAFYQTAKVLEIPLMFIGQLLVLRIRKGAKVVAALLVVVTGLLVAARTDVVVTLRSLLLAVAASVADCGYTLMAARARRSGVSADALLSAMAPMSVALLSFGLAAEVVGHGDNWKEELRWVQQSNVAWPLLLSCILAVGLNLSFFVVLGYFEPVTLSMFREVKTVLVIICGFILSGVMPSLLNAFGIGVTLVGAFMYAQVNR